MIKGIFETHVHVCNLERAKGFYEDKLGLKRVLELDDRRVVFYEMPNGVQIFGVWEIGEEKWTRSHFAFEVSSIEEATDWLKSRGIEPVVSFGLEPVEPVVHTWVPMACVYFQDLDGNSLEMAVRLPQPPAEKADVIYLSEWEERQRGNVGRKLDVNQ
ncbi:catechol 2,3-dioxygenase-like lactoylglutathione lyase family enzyme [Evansella vedderi]|uniref:Catechol 2,3-dioxygenase-like lactoylglutathione lyase family enzyme n=1 Tax=Evansella vedderi TaxID=38282 RepID=A0ABT9ZWQ0_9BACI|nr:VOC family protein [Evansella vedderi]MDQ0255176.1 catechol 2,3-dioxygenase-like lactoylglutathione lyase family enzyme [Evansella vedderi]